MGNCKGKNYDPFNKQNGSAFDRVTSRTSTDDDCLMYQLADYQKGGDLVKFFAKEGARATEDLLKEQMPMLLYRKGEGQIVTRADYLKWKYRGKRQVAVPINEDVPGWKDHKACWSFDFRGSLGESLLHVLIVCNTSMHCKLAKMLILAFPNLALDVVEGPEFRGASALHLAIAYNNLELIKLLVESGAGIEQRAVGNFFLPRDQQRARPSKTTDYEGLAYFGEFPLAWAACCNNEAAYNLLIDRGADPNSQDSFGNMVLHMVVVCDKLEMYGYALRHPRLPAKMGIVNKAGLTPLTLSCHLGRATIFREMLELTAKEFWRYSNITCSAYPLNALDTILPDGRCNMTSALMIILNGTKEEHLDMLDGGIIQRLLEEKWKTFARMQFLKRLGILFFHLLALSGAVYTRPSQDRPLMDDYDRLDATDFARFCFEIVTCLSCFGYVVIQQSSELKNLGLRGFLSQLSHNPAKAIFLASNLLTMACIPCRLMGERDLEEAILIFAVPAAWFFLMFFAGAIRLTGPFVTMIYSMITGDMLTFAIIYAVMLLAFSQAFYFLHRGHPDKPPLFSNFFSTWMGLFHWTLGDYNYPSLGETVYPALTKIVFVIFMIMVPILLLNMLIAMMGNTYALVIQQSEKEWVKQWAKIVIALERAVSQMHAKEYLVTYSIKVSGGSDGTDGTPPQEEVRGVMVIKSKNKTRARQRKGALNNWKRVGRVTINELKRRGIKGEHLRRQIWDPRTPSTTSVNASRCVTPVPGAAPTAAAMLLMDINGGPGVIGGGNTTTSIGVVEHNNIINGDPFLDNAFCFGANFNDLSGFANSNKPNNIAAHLAEPLNQEVFNAALLNKLSITSTFIEDVVESSYTAPVAAAIPETPKTIFPPLPPLPPVITSVPPISTTPITPVTPTTTQSSIFPPLHPPKEIEAVIEHLDNSAQLSDIENEIIAQTLLGSVPVSSHMARTSKMSATIADSSSPKEALPPLFRARLLDTPTLSLEGDLIGFGSASNEEKPSEIRRQQSSPVLFHRTNSIDLTGIQQSAIIEDNYQSSVFTDTETKCTRLPPLVVEEKVTSPESSGKSGKRNSKSRQKTKHQFSRSNVVAPSMDEPVAIYALEDHFTAPPDHVQDSSIFQRLNEKSAHQLTRSSTNEESQRHRKKPKLKSSSLGRRRHSDNESLGSSSGVDESLYTATRVANRNPRMDSRSSSTSSTQQTSNIINNPPMLNVESAEDPSIPAMIFHISGNLQENPSVEDDSPEKNISPRKSTYKKLTPRRSKLSSIKKVKKFTLFNKKDSPAILSVAVAAETNKILSSTSSRIDQAKADHFHSSAPAVMNLNHLLSGSESILTDDIDT